METEQPQHPVGRAWHQVAEVMAEQAALLDRLERIAESTRFDVGVVFDQVGEVKTPVKRMERANEFRFDRIDTQLEELAGGRSTEGPH